MGLLSFMFMAIVVLILACADLGWALASLMCIDGLTAYFATMPRGIVSVTIMALGSGADAPLVLVSQMLRLFALVLAGTILGRWRK